MGGAGSKVEQAHRVAWILKHGKIPEGKWVLHSCDNRKCVRHLYLGDHAQNMKDMKDRGRSAKGERHWSRTMPEKIRTGSDHHNAKLTLKKVEKLCADHQSGNYTQRQLAKRYGIGQPQVSRIVTRKQWARGG
jgi:hypothetical protein